MITSGGLGNNGFGFPAAIVVQRFRNRDTEVVCVTGDGGFQMNIQEMATAIVQGHRLSSACSITSILAWSAMMQQLFYGKTLFRSMLKQKKLSGKLQGTK